MKPSAIAATATLFLASTAQAGVVEIVWDPDRRYEEHLRIDAGGFLELCGKFSSGTQVRWQFEVDAPTSFNIHYHEGTAVHYPAKEENTRRSSGTLEVARDQDYCWMWTSRASAPSSVFVRLSRGR